MWFRFAALVIKVFEYLALIKLANIIIRNTTYRFKILSMYLQMCVVLAAILAIIIYRIFIVVIIYKSKDQFIKSQARIITTITAACLSVIVITLLNKLYEKIAIFLTNMGIHYSGIINLL